MNKIIKSFSIGILFLTSTSIGSALSVSNVEEGLSACMDRFDNDGDGLVDRKDPDCKEIIQRFKAAKRAKSAELAQMGMSWKQYKKNQVTLMYYKLIEEMEIKAETEEVITNDVSASVTAP